MAVQVVQLFPATVLTTGAATLFTVTGAPSVVLSRGRIRFTNTTAGAVTVTAYGIPSGGSAAVGNCFCYQQSVAGGNNLDIDVPDLVLGGFIQALASANTSITAHALDGVLFS